MPDTRMLTNSKVLLYNDTELQFVQPIHLLPFSIGPISMESKIREGGCMNLHGGEVDVINGSSLGD